jgi:hypothetical protein
MCSEQELTLLFCRSFELDFFWTTKNWSCELDCCRVQFRSFAKWFLFRKKAEVLNREFLFAEVLDCVCGLVLADSGVSQICVLNFIHGVCNRGAFGCKINHFYPCRSLDFELLSCLYCIIFCCLLCVLNFVLFCVYGVCRSEFLE